MLVGFLKLLALAFICLATTYVLELSLLDTSEEPFWLHSVQCRILLNGIDRITHLHLKNIGLRFSFWEDMLLSWVSVKSMGLKNDYGDEASPCPASCWRHRRSHPGHDL